MTVFKEYNPLTSQWETILVGNQGPEGPEGPEGPQGPDGKTFNFRGEWSLGNDYSNTANIDTVIYNGSSYACLVGYSDSDQPDVSPTVWVLLASAGESATVNIIEIQVFS